MTELTKEIAAYEKLRNDLETDHSCKWALVHDEELKGVFDTFEDAADFASRNWGRGPYLIKEIGAGPITLPASVLYGPIHA